MIERLKQEEHGAGLSFNYRVRLTVTDDWQPHTTLKREIDAAKAWARVNLPCRHKNRFKFVVLWDTGPDKYWLCLYTQTYQDAFTALMGIPR